MHCDLGTVTFSNGHLVAILGEVSRDGACGASDAFDTRGLGRAGVRARDCALRILMRSSAGPLSGREAVS